jgi:hypothetical protein
VITVAFHCVSFPAIIDTTFPAGKFDAKAASIRRALRSKTQAVITAPLLVTPSIGSSALFIAWHIDERPFGCFKALA